MAETNIKQIINSVFSDVDDDLQHFVPLATIASITHIRISYISSIILLIVLVMSFMDNFAWLVVNLFGIIYPLLMTLQALPKKEKRQSKKWLMYWVIFGFTIIIDIVPYTLPMYYSLKALFCLWLFYPRTNGMIIVYEKLTTFKQWTISFINMLAKGQKKQQMKQQ